jgi:hypothetical protein
MKQWTVCIEVWRGFSLPPWVPAKLLVTVLSTRLRTQSLPTEKPPPTPAEAEFPSIKELSTCTADSVSVKTPPPASLAVLPATVEFKRVRVHPVLTERPPPSSVAVLRSTHELSTQI